MSRIISLLGCVLFVFAHQLIYVCTRTCICIYIYMRICIYMYVYVHTHMYTYIHMYICMYLHAHICMYMDIYILTTYCIWSVISSFSNLTRRSSSLGLFYHVPLKRDQDD